MMCTDTTPGSSKQHAIAVLEESAVLCQSCINIILVLQQGYSKKQLSTKVQKALFLLHSHHLTLVFLLMQHVVKEVASIAIATKATSLFAPSFRTFAPHGATSYLASFRATASTLTALAPFRPTSSLTFTTRWTLTSSSRVINLLLSSSRRATR